MATKEEMEALWAALSGRLQDDPELAKTVNAIIEAVGDAASEPERPRLRVPYANAVSIEKESAWN